MLVFLILSSSLLDPERLLDRASNQVSEGYGYLVSYRNSVMFTKEHNRLSKLMNKLEIISEELEEISKDVQNI